MNRKLWEAQDDEENIADLARASETEYEIFKKALHGRYVPEVAPRKEWTWKLNVGGPELPYGQALLLAKKTFWNNQTGAPKFFDVSNKFILAQQKVFKGPDGWRAEFEFSGDFKREKGKVIQPTAQELAVQGFERVSQEESKPTKFYITKSFPDKPGLTEKQVAIITGQILLSLRGGELFNTITNVGVNNVEKLDDVWEVILQFDGDLKVSPEDPRLETQSISIDWD